MSGFASLEAKNADPSMGHVLDGGEDSPYVGAFLSAPTELTYKAAMHTSNPERDHWLIEMKDEIESLRAHGTWVLISIPFRQRVLPGRWLFVNKIGATGLVERYRARFVVKGFMQRPGIDFTDVYAPVSSKAGLRVLLSAITHRKMFVRQLDIKIAFLNGELEPDLDLYCHQPEGFMVLGPDGSPLVCKLAKSLYGLK